MSRRGRGCTIASHAPSRLEQRSHASFRHHLVRNSSHPPAAIAPVVGRDVFAYFNNDGGGNAVRNALTLKRMLGA